MSYADVNGIRLHLIDEGDGPPLVFVHGFPLDHSMWDAQRREFRSTHRVLIPDLRGFGKSDVSDAVTMDQFADDLAALLDVVGVSGPVTLCGLSMGGIIAMAFARKMPERLERLVLCDTRSVTDSPELAATRLKLAEQVLTEGPRVVVEAQMPRLFGPSSNEHHPAVVDAIRNVMLAAPSRGIAAAQRAMAARIDATPFLGSIRVPTLVVVGEYDAISPPSEMEALARAIPGAQFVVIPRAGHMAPTENPTAFNAALHAFLA